MLANLENSTLHYRAEKVTFSFQSQSRTIPKNVLTTEQLCSFYMLARLCSKSFKLGFNSTWIWNFQIYKLGFKEAEGPEIKLPASIGSWRKEGSSIKTSTSAPLIILKPLPIKICVIKAMDFPIVMYRCVSWTIKKAECWRIDTFK